MTRFLKFRFFKILGAIFSMTLIFAFEAQGQQVGDMIDAAMTAESALPKIHDEEKNPALDDAVKLALAKLPDGAKTESAIKTDGGTTVAETLGLPSAQNSADETKVPLFKNEAPVVKTKSAATESLWWRMWGSLAIVLTLLGGGFYAFKKWPGAKKLTQRNRMIEVLSQHHLGPKRSIAVVRVAGEACLIGVTDNNISILKTLSLLDDDIPAQTQTQKEARSESGAGGLAAKFQKTLAAQFTKSSETNSTPDAKPAYYTRNAKKTTAESSNPEVNEDDFTMQGLREIVGEKLKTMREL